MNKAAWKPDDKAWLKQRKAEWSFIVKRLDRMHITKKRYYKYHKQLFFTGEFSITEEDRLHFAEPFDVYQLLFDLWYYPDVDELAYRQIVDEFLSRPIMPEIKVKRFDFSRNNFMATTGGVVDSDYGFMGGREECLVNVFFPSYDFDEVIDIGSEGFASAALNLGPHPARLLRYVSYGLLPLLKYGSSVYLRYPGNYLWPHLDFALNKDEKRVVDVESYEYKTFIELLYVLKHPSVLPDLEQENARAAEIAELHKSRFDNREYGPVLMRYWENIDDLYNAQSDS